MTNRTTNIFTARYSGKCNKCGVSYMKSGRDRLRFPTNSELDHHTNVGDTD
jgi:hypothetical protein